MTKRMLLLSLLCVACTHTASVLPKPNAISVDQILAKPSEFARKELTVGGYWVQTGGGVWLFGRDCPIEEDAIQLVLLPGAVKEGRQYRAIRKMTRNSGVTFERSIATIDSEVAYFEGRGTFEFTPCPPEPAVSKDSLVIPDEPELRPCVSHRFIVSRIETLTRIPVERLPSCFRGGA